MFTQLRMQKFKGWKDTETIAMAPITLFFGANSSGKSSIGQFLMMLKQTTESPDRKAVFYPGGKNSAVQLGSYQEMVTGRNVRSRMEFSYQWQPEFPFSCVDPLSGASFSGDALAFRAKAGLFGEERNTLVLDEFQYQLLDTVKDDAESLAIGMQRKRDKLEYQVQSEGYVLKRKKGRAWNPGTPVRFYGFPEEVIAYHQNADFVQTLNLAHEKLFRSLSYLGPLRTKAERFYSWTGIEPESVGYSGENTIAAILAARSRKLSLGYRQRTHPFEEVIAAKLQELGLIEDFRVNRISEQRQEYEVKLRGKGSKDWVDLPDVGFGISQVLPVLAQCFYAPPGSIILMEQPEIHLHPSAQSNLADILIDVIHSRENGEDRNIQLIIETHSEHFLRRLQRRIAEEKIEPSKVSAYFANNASTPAKLEALQLDEYGNIRNWPENFFGDEMGDITGQAKAAMEKRIRQSEAS